MLPYVFVLLVILGAVILIARNYLHVRAVASSATIPANMQSLAQIIRNGASVFMRREYSIIVPVVLFLAGLFCLFIETWSGLTLILGATLSSGSCIISMRGATYANLGTANTARTHRKVGSAQQVAICGGSIGGISVQSFGLLGLVVLVLTQMNGFLNPISDGHGLLLNVSCNAATIRITTYSLGCSIIAMFNRVAGGNYTKAADISADIVGKNRYNMPEDDSRMPNTIADFIGDNVNDVSGNCSDLLESFVASCVSCILNAVNMFNAGVIGNTDMLKAGILFPLILAGGGLLSCLISIAYSLMHRSSNRADHEVNMITYVAAGSTVIAGAIAAYLTFGNITLHESFRLGWASPWIASILGIISGVAIGKITEYYTGLKSRPVREVARYATEGVAFAATKCDAAAWRSCLASICMIASVSMAAFSICGYYGVSAASLGMLSFVAATVTIDAFGPIADNAGGIAESCHLDPEVRKITDELDALGNTTAAVGKGLAIGSAASATLSLLVSYVGSYSTNHDLSLNIISIGTIAGCLFGAALVPYFSGLLSDNTIDSAYLMAEEGDRQLSIPGVLEGTVQPDYERVISMAANEALKRMLKPSIIAIAVPAISRILLGPEFVGGIIVGATMVAIPMAIFMGNSGGIADNAKKFIEAGLLEGHGKGSEAHKAAVSCDTEGDTRKDVVAVALDIFIKIISVVANTLAPMSITLRLF